MSVLEDAVCYSGLFLLALPSLSGTKGQWERRRESWRLLQNVYRVVDWKYILHAFHWSHTPGLSALLCVCARACHRDQRVKGPETTELRFIVVGLLAHMCVYAESKSKSCCKKRKSVSKCDGKMVNFPVTCAIYTLWERFRPEPALMWMLCTVAILWCWVKKK